MTALAIVGGIIAVLVLILLCPIRLLLSYDGDFSIKVGIPIFKILLYPSDEALLASDAVSVKKKRKILKKILKKEKRAEKKAAKGKKAAKKSSSAARKKAAPSKEGQAKKSILRDLRFLARVGKILGIKFGRKLSVKVRRLEIDVATADAANTAYLYGAVTQGVSYLFAVLGAYAKLKDPYKHTRIRADFLRDETVFRCDIRFSISVASVLSLVFNAVWLFVKEAFRKNTASAPMKGDGGEKSAKSYD